MIKTYSEALTRIFKNEVIKDYSLETINKALIMLDNPLENIKIIHIAGTNWKWSVAKMTYSVLKQAGINVWVFTSPHLIDIRERFETIDWRIKKKEFVKILNKILILWLNLTYFEICTLIAFEFFKLKKVEYAVLEVWLWWRLDATNIVSPIITCITNISFDHQEFLWDTIEKISEEKAWIIKDGIPIIINHKNITIEEIAIAKWSKLIFSNKLVKTNLLWDYQEKNAWLSFEICKYIWIDENTILKWLQKVWHNWRLQYIKDNILVDWAHNEWWLVELNIYLNKIKNKYSKINYCFSLKKWKNINLVVDKLWEEKNYILIDNQNIILESSQMLQKQFRELWFFVPTFKKQDLLNLAKNNKTELFVVFWSLYMIWEFLG